VHIEFFVEERSAEAALLNLLPKIVGNRATWAIHPFGGKMDLLCKLPSRLRAYARWMPSDRRLVVLVDEDRQDCRRLKRKLEEAAWNARLGTPAHPLDGRWTVINRMAIEELEAWYFGDWEAVRQAYPHVPETITRQAPYRNPDAIKGGTWEALERVLIRAGYYAGGMPKTETAREISLHMNPDRNRSRSFNLFVRTLRNLLA
jgi:hypothetical protein